MLPRANTVRPYRMYLHSVCHPERRKSHSVRFSQSNPTQGRARSGIYNGFSLCSAEIPPFGAFLPCHPERSRNPNNVRIKRAVASLGSRQKKFDLAYAPLRMTRRGVKISNFIVFRTVEDACPYINEVCAYIGRAHNVR